MRSFLSSEVVLPVGMFLFSLAYFVQSLDYPTKAARFPQLLIVMIWLGLAILAYQKIRDKLRSQAAENTQPSTVTGEEKQEAPQLISRLLFFILGIVVYYLIVAKLGFLLTTFGVLLGLMLLFGVRPRTSLTISLVLVTLFHVLFRVEMGVPLPRGIGEQLLNTFLRAVF